jgi:hypothetical protein
MRKIRPFLFSITGEIMKEKSENRRFCFNLKLPDHQCQQCIWLEWNEDASTCLNRKRMICNLYVEEVFGNLVSERIN